MMEQMKVEMTYEAIGNLVQQSFTAGMLQYRNMVKPESDKIKQREAKRYLQLLGYEPKLLDELVEQRRIHRRKDGDAKSNCAIYYSLSEIQRQIVTIEMKKGKLTQIFP